MTSSPKVLGAVQQKIWDGHIPLQIHLSSAESTSPDDVGAYYVRFPNATTKLRIFG
jgi:hypothetical protein